MRRARIFFFHLCILNSSVYDTDWKLGPFTAVLLPGQTSPWATKYKETMVCACWVVSDSCNSMDCSPPGSSVHGILQARVLEWVAISYSKGSSRLKDWTHVSCISSIGRWILYHHCHLQSPTTDNHVLLQLGQIMDNKIQKDQKSKCHFWRAVSKSRVLGEKKQATAHAPCILHHLMGGQTA